MKTQQFPKGWDERRARELAEHYDNQSDTEAAAEHEAAMAGADGTLMEVPTELVPVFRELITRLQQARRSHG